MLKITSFTADNLEEGLITDSLPIFQFSLDSDKENDDLREATLTFSNGHIIKTDRQVDIKYDGEKLSANQEYSVELKVVDIYDEVATRTLKFKTGKMNTPFKGKWISDAEYIFKEKRISPKVMTFKKNFQCLKNVKEVRLEITALGMYTLFFNEERIMDNFFAPGFTSYHHQIQYQTYDLTKYIKTGENELIIPVSGGWAVGSFVFTRVNRYYAKRQALLFDLTIVYEDDSMEIIKSDEETLVSMESPFLLADLYDGETYSFNIDYKDISFHNAKVENLKFKPKLLADYSSMVKVRKTLLPTYIKTIDGEDIFDFKQNFAGIIKLKIKDAIGKEKIIIHHAEVLNADGSLNLSLLRLAKATLTIYPKKGDQIYIPTFTYMGFRYITLSGIPKEKVEIEGLLLSSLDDSISSFKCNDEKLNRLEQNIRYSSLANFMDIPTDCPQRDERMGWTGDISIFANTACFNYSIDRFLRKWLKDLKSEQLKSGGVPNTIPIHGYKFPATMPKMAVEFWGDTVINVPLALYYSYGDKSILLDMYENMKRYVKACKFWANLLSIGKHRYIWHTPSLFHFGDWVSPDVDKMSVWQKRSKYTATASLCNTSFLLSKIASILDKKEDSLYFKTISKKAAQAYSEVFLTKEGKLKKEEFQTGYVLPLAFNMLDEKKKQGALVNLVSLIKKNDYCINTGFPGTPYILSVLTDNGYADIAYRMLLNTKPPSWLYAVEAGGTTIWEKFDGMNKDGTAKKSTDGTDNMISFNHYASGSVGEFLYTRLCGLRIIKPGYKEFTIEPVFSKNVNSIKLTKKTPYGDIYIFYKIDNDKGNIEIKVPVSTICKLKLPKVEKTFGSGSYQFEFQLS